MKRVAASVSAAAAPVTGVCLSAAVPASGASAVHQRVTASDLGRGRAWLRLQDDPGNASRAHGVQQVSPFADPQHWNGSLHLEVGTAPSQQSQAAHYFAHRVPLATMASSTLAGRGLSARNLTVTIGGRRAVLSDAPGGRVVAVVAPRPDTELTANGSTHAPVTVTWAGAHGPDRVTATAELLARGYRPLQPTGEQHDDPPLTPGGGVSSGRTRRSAVPPGAG